MSKNMASKYKHDTYVELQRMVTHFYDVSKRMDKKIEELMTRVSVIRRKEEEHDPIKGFLIGKTNDLKQNQELLKKGFTGPTIKKFCQSHINYEGEDYTCLEVVELFPPKGTKTVEEIKLAIQELERLNEKQVKLCKEMEELELQINTAFPDQKGYFRKEFSKDEISKIQVGYLNETRSWLSLDQVILDFHHGDDGDEEDHVEWSLTKVMMDMYGIFELNKAKKAEEILRHHFKEALDRTSKSHRDYIEKNLRDEVSRSNESKLEGLLATIKAIKKPSEFDEERCEAKNLMMGWLYQIEEEILLLINDLLILIPTNIPDQIKAATYRGDFGFKLEGLKRRKHGRVPIVVYQLLTLLEEEMVAKVIKRRKMFPAKLSIVQVMDQLYKVILCLTYVLNFNLSFFKSSISKKDILFESIKVVKRCDEEWRAIRMEINRVIGEA